MRPPKLGAPHPANTKTGRVTSLQDQIAVFRVIPLLGMDSIAAFFFALNLNRKDYQMKKDQNTPEPDNTVPITRGILNLFNEKETAEMLGLASQTLSTWRSSSSRRKRRKVGLPFILVGGAVRYRLRDIEAFLDSRTIGSDGVTPPGVQRGKGGPGRPKRTVRA